MHSCASSTPAVPDQGSGRVLLLCPPANRIYHRDNYCSHEVKASYYWHPYDLVAQSGILASVAPIEVLDAPASKLSVGEALTRIQQRGYRAVLALSGGVCWDEDIAFLRQVQETTRAPMYLSGDVACAHPGRVLDSLPFVAGILMDYTSDGLARHLGGKVGDGLFLRDNPIQQGCATASPRTFSLPLPRWDLFPKNLYRTPFQRERHFASVAASFGCPGSCSFCTAARLTFKRRDLDNLFEELHWLKRAGYREIHFRDLSFAADPSFVDRLLDRMLREQICLTFSCLARADHLEPKLVRKLKHAGCHLIHIGVESASEESLRRTNKGLHSADARAAIRTCKNEGIEVLASYMLGLPWETRADVERTIQLAISLDTEYASFNLYTSRASWPPPNREGTPNTGDRDYDLARMRRHAYRRFYARPSYLIGCMRTHLTPTRLPIAVANGWSLLRRHGW